MNNEAQEELLNNAIEDLINTYGEEELREEAEDMNIDYWTFIREKAESHMYSFDFVFNI